MLPQPWGVWPHPASTAIGVEILKPTRQILRQYGIPLLGVGLVGLGKLGWDSYQTHVETHELNKPWEGKLIKVGKEDFGMGRVTPMGNVLETFRVFGTLARSPPPT
jgi:hypothetical protein